MAKILILQNLIHTDPFKFETRLCWKIRYDLARDGAFKGSKIAVLHLYTFGGFDFKYPQAALEQKGFQIKVNVDGSWIQKSM